MNIIGTKVEVTKGQVLRYMFLPQIAPRLNGFYQQGFSQLAYLMALVFRAVNILPASHLILRKDNRRTLALRDVIAAATAEIQWTRGNIDKIIIYLLILLGFFLLIGQVFLALAYVMVRPSYAGMPTSYADFFDTPNYNYDVAYRLLFAVFGVPELFNNIIGPVIPTDPFHIALHSLFQLYSVGLLVVGVIITCYFIFAVLVETAQTGVPFGKRYNHVWTPIRLVVALGLLIPMGYGLNAAQWITLYAAKFGSDFATRGWIIFVETMNQEFLEDAEERVGQPQTPDVTNLAAYMSTILACREAYNIIGPTYTPPKVIDAYLVRPNSLAPPNIQFIGASFPIAREFFNNGDIIVRFGERSPQLHGKMLGSVYPYCGEVVISAGDSEEPGSLAMQSYYYDLIRVIWHFGDYEIRDTMADFVRRYIDLSVAEGGDPNADDIPVDFKQTVIESIRADIEAEIVNAVDLQASSASWDQDLSEMRERGWGGAGIWFNKIAQINGSLVTSVNNLPEARAMPAVLEYIKKRSLMQNVETAEPYNANQADNIEMEFESELVEKVGRVLSAVVDYWNRETPDQTAEGNQVRRTNNIFIDAINMIFGTRGLFNMCANADTHPLAQLSILGKGLVEASMRNMAWGLTVGVGGGLLPGFLGSTSAAAGSIFVSLAMMTMTMGFLLFYVVPFMPFLYYFFAVGAWVKGIFEAMVGVPLWALAHLRIDGEGLPGDAAMDGYYLIFEIFLRPILIVFGLLASVVIFGSMVKVLNEIYSLVVYNLSGHDRTVVASCGGAAPGPGPTGPASPINFFRGPIDEFFFTVIYAIIVYMIGMSCFKLIDLIPNNILRYMGVGIETYNDSRVDPADGLMIRLSMGMNSASSTVGSISNNMITGARGVGQFAENVASPPPAKK